MHKKINIAIDGYSACGKSTLAKELASELSYVYIDSGAMYRAITFFFLNQHIQPFEEEKIELELSNINITFQNKNGENTLFLNQIPLNRDIRTMEISENVSKYATISSIRKKMVIQQQEMANSLGFVMDGRDIGTVVLPNADLKLFLICDLDVRTKRRAAEFDNNNIPYEIEKLKLNLQERDYIDSHRKDSPLKKADDAIIIDSTNLSEIGQKTLAMNYVNRILNG